MVVTSCLCICPPSLSECAQLHPLQRLFFNKAAVLSPPRALFASLPCFPDTTLYLPHALGISQHLTGVYPGSSYWKSFKDTTPVKRALRGCRPLMMTFVILVFKEPTERLMLGVGWEGHSMRVGGRVESYMDVESLPGRKS